MPNKMLLSIQFMVQINVEFIGTAVTHLGPKLFGGNHTYHRSSLCWSPKEAVTWCVEQPLTHILRIPGYWNETFTVCLTVRCFLNQKSHLIWSWAFPFTYLSVSVQFCLGTPKVHSSPDSNHIQKYSVFSYRPLSFIRYFPYFNLAAHSWTWGNWSFINTPVFYLLKRTWRPTVTKGEVKWGMTASVAAYTRLLEFTVWRKWCGTA